MATLAESGARSTRTVPAALARNADDEDWNDGSSSFPTLTKRASDPRVMTFIRDDWIRRQMLERDGGMFGCELPSGHSGPHALDAANGTLRPNRQRFDLARRHCAS